VLLHVSEETIFCVSGRISRDCVLCFWTYLRRLCSVFLDVSEETIFCVIARIWSPQIRPEAQNIVSSDTCSNTVHSLLRYVQKQRT
jgi:hypothetical protein